MSTVRTVIAVAASNKWNLYQLDINNAFLHGDLHEDVYMSVPQGVPNDDKKVCKLIKSLYGLKQASRQWHEKLVASLQQQGFHKSHCDHSLFIKKRDNLICILAVYVDDIILTGTDEETITQVKLHLHTEFSIKDLGILHFFLGIEVGYTIDGIILSQTKFTKELLSDCGLDVSKKTSTPLPLNVKLSALEGDPLSDVEWYRSMVGKLNFFTNTRPDLSYAVQSLSQFMQAPTVSHKQALHHTLRYIGGSIGQGILLKSSTTLSLQAFSDSDWASCPDSRRSVTGYIMMLGGSPISWKSKKQSVVSRSSSEAEYRAMAAAASEVTWLIRLLAEMNISDLLPVVLHCDNQSALHIARNPDFHERTKHIEIDCHFTRDKVLEGLIQLTYLPTQHQLADVFTKILPSHQYKELLSKLGMDFPSPLT